MTPNGGDRIIQAVADVMDGTSAEAFTDEPEALPMLVTSFRADLSTAVDRAVLRRAGGVLTSYGLDQPCVESAADLAASAIADLLYLADETPELLLAHCDDDSDETVDSDDLICRAVAICATMRKAKRLSA